MATQTLFCRLTLDKTKEEIQTILSKKYSAFVISEEEANNKHFHILIYHNDSNGKNARQNLRNFLKKEYPELMGNGSYSITETKVGTEKTLTKYVIKDGNFIYQGIEPSVIETLKKQSYKKFKGDEFKRGLQDLRDRYIADRSMSLVTHISQILKYKCVDYNQDCNMNLIKNFAITSYMKKEGTNDIAVEIYNQIFRV